MGRNLSIVNEPPNAENTIHVGIYRQSSPERFSCPDDDKFVLYAGASDLELDLIAETSILPEIGTIELFSCLTVYVLNTNVLLWSKTRGIGVSIPYQCISIHGLQDGNLYMQLSENPIFQKPNSEPAEICFSVNPAHASSKSHAPVDTSLLGVSSSLSQLYEAIAQCSATHLDSDLEDDEDCDGELEYDLAVPAQWLDGHDHETVVSMHGNADDLDGDDTRMISVNDGEAGMDVDVGHASIAGSIRKLGEDSGAPCPKKRAK